MPKLRDQIKKIMLIFPPSTSPRFFEPMVSPPMGIAYLAASVREAGYEVSCLDCLVEAPYQEEKISEQVVRLGLTVREIMARIEAERPDVVGLSCIFSNQWLMVQRLADEIKARDPSIPVIAGGTHPSFLAEECLLDSKVDFVVQGEGDRTLVLLLDALRERRDLAEVTGIAYRDDDGRVRINPRTPLIEDLDTLPFPAHDLLPVEKYIKLALPMAYEFISPRNIPIVTSRGCPCRCRFCSSSHHWGRYRARSPENVLAEMDWLVERFGIGELKIQDDNFSLQRDRTIKILNMMIERPYHLHWNTPNGIATWTLDDEVLGLMKKSGCFQLTFAIESGDQEVMDKIINKPLRLEKVLEVNALARKHGIQRTAYFIIGFPGETRAQIMNTVNLSHALRLHFVGMFIYNPLPGSPMWDECLERGIIKDTDFVTTGNQYFSTELRSEDWDPVFLERTIRREWARNYGRFFNGPYFSLRRYFSYLRHRPSFLKFFLVRSLYALRLWGAE